MDVITSHINADFDAFASATAALKLYPNAVIVFPGSMEKRVREFIEVFHPVPIKRVRDISLDAISRLIIVDTKHPDRLGPLSALIGKPGVKIHIFDHHPPHKDDIRGDVELIEQVGAAATLFAEIFQRDKIVISPIEATLLCLGIYEETGSMMFTSTTPRDLVAAAYLLKRGANLSIVAEFLKTEISREEIALLNELVGSLREETIHGVRIRIAKGTTEGFFDVAPLAHKIMDIEEMDALFLLVSVEDKIVIVARSKVSEMNVAPVMEEFGGGGHATAASATIRDMPLEIVEERLVMSLRLHIRPIKVAADVMTAPVISTECNSRIIDAEKKMTNSAVNVLPVLRRGRYSGIITREVIEKALLHGFGNSDCIDFATTDALTAEIDTPVSDIEKGMIEQNQRFVPVLNDDVIVGAITRTDILRAMYEDFLRKSKVPGSESGKNDSFGGFGKNIASIVREGLPPDAVSLLHKAGEVADRLEYGAYLVGGCVRDLLRREQNLDIDIVVEGNGIELARILAAETGAKVTVHRVFGTAQVSMPAQGDSTGLRLDVATARTEYYKSPATLPVVEVSSIKKDLYRRDFTINTLAVKLNEKDFGLLIDFFGGQRDLKEKSIRVLHNLSFVEDPTRAFRAVRFAERFGFKLTRHTENLIRIALRMNIFDKLSGTRICDELMLLFRETDPVRAVRRLADYELLGVIHPKLVFSPELDQILQSVHDVTTWFDYLYRKDSYNKESLYFMALLARFTDEEQAAALKRLAMPDSARRRIPENIGHSRNILKEINPGDPVALYHLLSGSPLEAILFSMALTRSDVKKKGLSQFLLEYRSVKPIITGEDLKSLGIAPGPVYSKILRSILDRKLMKGLKTREEELEFARAYAGDWKE